MLNNLNYKNITMDKKFIDELVNMVFLSDAGITSTSKEQIENTIINELKALASIIYELNKVIYQSNVELILKSISSIDKYYCSIVEYSQEGTSNCGNIFSGYDILDNYQKLQNLCDKRTFGQYYTPKLIVKSILDSLEIDYKNLEKFKILDPTCGGGAFFLGILDECKQANVSKDKTIEIVNKSFYGCDLNPNAVFLTKLCIIIHLNYLYEDFSFSNDLRKLSFDDHFTQGNTLLKSYEEKFDFIIGNPPYFKIKKSEKIQIMYKSYLYGQGNVYALFLVWSLWNINTTGKVSFIIPQSIKNGKYFCRIREELIKHNILFINYIDSNKKNLIFNDVEQAVFILGYEKICNKNNNVKLSFSDFGEQSSYIQYLQNEIFDNNGFLTPCSSIELKLLKKLKQTKRFKEIEPDLRFGNGLFVWNQQKENLVNENDERSIPIVYANYVKEGVFIFNPDLNTKGRKPFARVVDCNRSFKCSGRKIIVKRTSSNEKFTRIRACLIDKSFSDKNKDYFIENHLNMLYNIKDKNLQIDEETMLYILAFLTSNIANYFIKQVNGNTQVSANELNELPYKIYRREEITSLMRTKQVNYDAVNKIFYEAFKLTKSEIKVIENLKEECK